MFAAPNNRFQWFMSSLVIFCSSILTLLLLFLAIPLERLPFFSAYMPNANINNICSTVSQAGGTAISVTLDSTADNPGVYTATITYTCNGSRADMVLGAMKIMRALYTDTSFALVNYCTLFPQTTFTDYYGRTSVARAATMALGRNVARLVVWENLTAALFERLLINEGEWWVHGDVL